jgi:Uma2 family endonuclease
MPKTATKIGPNDNGQPMRLKDFEHAQVQEGYVYELGRGLIVVSDVPKPHHLIQIDSILQQLTMYQVANPASIFCIAGGSDCKILASEFESERHPDLAIYQTPPPEEDDPWSYWIPEIVIEVVSLSSKVRDYKEKPEEYLAFGVREYWIFDASKTEMRVLRRSGGRWNQRIIRPPTIYRTGLLPGLEFDCKQVFAPVAKRRKSNG